MRLHANGTLRSTFFVQRKAALVVVCSDSHKNGSKFLVGMGVGGIGLSVTQ